MRWFSWLHRSCLKLWTLKPFKSYALSLLFAINLNDHHFYGQMGGLWHCFSHKERTSWALGMLCVVALTSAGLSARSMLRNKVTCSKKWYKMHQHTLEFIVYIYISILHYITHTYDIYIWWWYSDDMCEIDCPTSPFCLLTVWYFCNWSNE